MDLVPGDAPQKLGVLSGIRPYSGRKLLLSYGIMEACSGNLLGYL